MKAICYSIIALLLSLTATAQEEPVRLPEVPSEARIFIKKHFNSPFLFAVKEVRRQMIAYHVVLEDGTEIEFTESGQWMEVDGNGDPIPYSFIHPKILDYVKREYEGEEIVKMERNTVYFEAGVSSGDTLIFNAYGNLVRIE